MLFVLHVEDENGVQLDLLHVLIFKPDVMELLERLNVQTNVKQELILLEELPLVLR